jgi:hypothetical protein
LITAASIALGIYIQTTSGPYVGNEGGEFRALYALTALVPFAVGILVVAAGHLVLLRETESDLPRAKWLAWLGSERPERV